MEHLFKSQTFTPHSGNKHIIRNPVEKLRAHVAQLDTITQSILEAAEKPESKQNAASPVPVTTAKGEYTKIINRTIFVMYKRY